MENTNLPADINGTQVPNLLLEHDIVVLGDEALALVAGGDEGMGLIQIPK